MAVWTASAATSRQKRCTSQNPSCFHSQNYRCKWFTTMIHGCSDKHSCWPTFADAQCPWWQSWFLQQTHSPSVEWCCWQCWVQKFPPVHLTKKLFLVKCWHAGDCIAIHSREPNDAHQNAAEALLVWRKFNLIKIPYPLNNANETIVRWHSIVERKWH